MKFSGFRLSRAHYTLLLFNGLLMRTLRHYFNAGYDVRAVFASFMFQRVFVVGQCAFAFADFWIARRESIVQALIFCSIGRVTRKDSAAGVRIREYRVMLPTVVGVTSFVRLNAMSPRTLHYWFGVPQEPDAMLRSMLA